MKTHEFNKMKYELIEDYEQGFVPEEVQQKLTDFFRVYDYVIGDWSYGKLRLKGFCDKENKYYNEINGIEKKESYINENCAYGCKYFVLKKHK